MKILHILFCALVWFAVPAQAQTPAGAVTRNQWITTNIPSCFPDNTVGAITPLIMRGCMTTLANSVLFSDSALADLPSGPATMPSGFAYPAPNLTGTVLFNGTPPSLIAGANVTITGSWPNQTITSAGASPILNVSGSAQTTTGSVAGTTALTLAAAKDFVNGQGIAIENAGASFTASAPTSLAVVATGATGQGPTGSTVYAYKAACVDGLGGVGAATTAASISNGYATLGTVTVTSSEVAYNHVTWTQGAGCVGTAIWRSKSSGAYVLLGVFTSANYWRPILDDTGLPTLTIPWIPATPPASALPDRLVTSIVSGGGTTSLVLANAATQTNTGLLVRHDDSAALLTYMTGTPNVVLAPGTYNVEPFTIPTNVGNLDCQSPGTTHIFGYGDASSTVLATGMPTGFRITSCDIESYSISDAAALEVDSTGGAIISGNILSGNDGLVSTSLTNSIISNNHITAWYDNAIRINTGNGSLIIGRNIAEAGSVEVDGDGITVFSAATVNVENNIVKGGEIFGYFFDGAVNSRMVDNISIQSLREAYHIDGNALNWSISNNYAGSNISIDYCLSVSDDTAVVTNEIGVISNNQLSTCGSSGIAIADYETSSVTKYITITGNVMQNVDQSLTAGQAAVLLSGSGVTYTFVNNNTYQLGDLAWQVLESNAYGSYPDYTQVGTMFGTGGGSGKASLTGSHSAALTGGSTGL